jgi:ABC-type bacteriocin/lantibiotic exporter with double-glycine peptidase domain
LIELIKEIQLPDVTAGTNLYRIAETLNLRGIHTSALNIGDNLKINWHSPVIAHLDDVSAGHYIVLMPRVETKSGDKVEFWDGLRGITQWTSEEFSVNRSGVVLLTSAERISDPGSALQFTKSNGYAGKIALGIFSVILLGALAIAVKNPWARVLIYFLGKGERSNEM